MQFRRCLEEMNLIGAREIWRKANPATYIDLTDEETIMMMHVARTSSNSVRFKYRAYSHSWLHERGLPSLRPDHLRSRAQRICPVRMPAAAIAVRNTTPIALAIRRAMEEAVLDAGLKKPDETKRAILNARDKARRKLLGI